MLTLKALAAIAAITMTVPAGNLLRRELKAGQDEYVVQVTNTTTPGEGMPGEPHTLKVSWKAVYKVGTPEAGKPAPLEVSITDYTMGGDARIVKQPEAVRSVKGTIDERNRIVVTEAKPEPPSTTVGWLLSDVVELPEGEVNVGDAWDVSLPKGVLLGDQPLKVQAKLTGEAEYEGHPAWVVTIEKKNVPVSQKVKFRMGDDSATREGTVTGTANFSIKALIEKGTCRTLSLTAKVHKDQEMSFEGAPTATKTAMDYTSTFKLKPAQG